MIAVDADLLKPLVDSAESARNLRAVGIGKRIGQRDEVLLFGNHVVGHTAVALPAVSAAILLARARNHVAAPAIVAHAAAGNVIDNHAIAALEASAPRPLSHNLPAWLVAGDHALVAFRPLAEMLVINAANVGTADGGRLDAQQNFSMPRQPAQAQCASLRWSCRAKTPRSSSRSWRSSLPSITVGSCEADFPDRVSTAA